ncbi:MAG: helix-turn-helix domain-containing protein [Bacteroidota bacterium]
MLYEFADKKLGATFGYTDQLQKDQERFSIKEGIIQLLWNRNEEPIDITVDGITFTLQPHQLTSLTFFHQVNYPEPDNPITAFLFNRAFYCISDHDEEVSCNGILFFGTQDLPIITIPKAQYRKFELLLEVMIDEFKTVDNIQGDMLKMLLKRLIIIITRLAKEQLIVETLSDNQVDTIRAFNVLVDLHFRSKHKVKDYAEMLFKSPKTLSNLFATYNQKTPQQIIQERIVLEAKRLLLFTDKQNQEIAYELGFEDPSYFSRVFKKVTGVNMSSFRGMKA